MQPTTSRRRRIALGAITATCLALLMPSTGFAATQATGNPGTTTSTSSCQPGDGHACPKFRPMITGQVLAKHESTVLSTSQCEAELGIACYTGPQLRTAYNVGPLYRRGITGAGQTILVVDFVGSPTLQHDVNEYSRAMGLPPATVTVDHYDGSPAFDPTDPGEVGWAQETTLDVEAAHLYAPGARIEVVLPDPSSNAALPAAIKAAIDKNPRISVMSFSFGAPEIDFYDPQTRYAALEAMRGVFQYAAERGITLVASDGDWGAATMQDDGSLSTGPATCWPASDPDVVAVGGTSLHLDGKGKRLSPDTVWNDKFGASGGTTSAAFSRPKFQDGVKSVTGDHRGVPDISASADTDGGIEVYWSMVPGSAGWAVVGGTSEAAPTVAGIVALADQGAGRRLGKITDSLYQLQREVGYNGWSGLVPVTSGNNSWGGVTGYQAGPGYNLAAGLGTFNAARLVPALDRLGARR